MATTNLTRSTGLSLTEIIQSFARKSSVALAQNAILRSSWNEAKGPRFWNCVRNKIPIRR
jgi:hypothetical protein